MNWINVEFHAKHLIGILKVMSKQQRKLVTFCPFCAGLDSISEQWIEGACQVKCNDCGACGPIGDTKAEARKLWRERPNLFISGKQLAKAADSRSKV